MLYRTLLPGFLLLILFSNCGVLAPKSSGTAAEAIVSPIVASMLEPNENGLPFPVYSEFSQIEPLLRQQDGITYVVNFWATWCRPCIKEIAFLERLNQETSRSDLQVIMISLDKPEEVSMKLKDYVKTRPLNLPVVAFTDNFYDGWIYKVDDAWQRSTIPTTLVYRNGERYFNRGQISSYEELRGLVDRVR